MLTSGTRFFTWSTLVNDCGGMALASIFTTFTSAAERGTRLSMSRAATTTGFRVMDPPATPPPPLEPRKRNSARAATATTAPMIVKGLPLMACRF